MTTIKKEYLYIFLTLISISSFSQKGFITIENQNETLIVFKDINDKEAATNNSIKNKLSFSVFYQFSNHDEEYRKKTRSFLLASTPFTESSYKGKDQGQLFMLRSIFKCKGSPLKVFNKYSRLDFNYNNDIIMREPIINISLLKISKKNGSKSTLSLNIRKDDILQLKAITKEEAIERARIKSSCD